MGPQIRLYKLWVSVTVPRALRRLRAALLVLFGLFVLYLVLYIGYTGWRLWQVDQGWASSFESMQAFAASFPKTATSSGAWQLHELTQPLGIDMVGKTAQQDRLDAIGAFLTAQRLVADDTTRTASAAVTQFLGKHARRIDAIVDLLLDGSELSWERDLKADLLNLTRISSDTYTCSTSFWLARLQSPAKATRRKLTGASRRLGSSTEALLADTS